MAKEIYNKNAREKALMEEAYSQVNEARFWGDKEGVARHNKELRDSGARSFEHPGGHGTTGHFTDEQVEKLKQKGYKEREIKDIEDAEDAEFDKEDDYWTTYFKKGDRIKFNTGRGFQVGGTVEDVGADAVLVRDEHGETLAVWKKNIAEVLPEEDGENPDAHTYNKKGRMAGPAAQLDPNIGFSEEEAEVEIDSKVMWRQEDGGLRRGIVDRVDAEHAYIEDDDGGINKVTLGELKVVTDEEYTFGPEPSEGNEAQWADPLTEPDVEEKPPFKDRYDPDEQKFRNVKPPSKPLTKDQAARIDANRAKLHASKVKSKFGGERYD